MLEPYAVKVARTVLRRGGASNRVLLSLQICSPGYLRKSEDDIIERNHCSQKILKVTFWRNDAWNVRRDAPTVKFDVLCHYSINIIFFGYSKPLSVEIVKNRWRPAECQMYDLLKNSIKRHKISLEYLMVDATRFKVYKDCETGLIRFDYSAQRDAEGK